MKIEKIKEDKNRFVFVLKDSNDVTANTLRRAMMSEVPVMAIDEVNFHKNDSALFDEMLALRLGLVPLITDLKSYKLKEECTCKGEGCPKCELMLILKAKGPITVYAKDIQSNDPKIKAVYPDLPIVKLDENQELEFEAKAVLGKGKEHSKYSPGLIYFKAYPIIETKGNVSNIKNLCPKDVLEVKGNKVIIKDLLKCDLCEVCAENNNNIFVKPSEKNFVFAIETWGQLQPKQILIESLNIMEKKLENLAKEIKKIK